MEKIISKSITMLLALCMVLGLFGSGENAIVNAATSSDEYTIITTAAELDNIRNNLSGKYILGNDIDLSSYSYNSSSWTSSKGWLGIGTTQAMAFKGVLDGNGYTISGLWSNSRGSNQGLFGWLSGATIKNLNIATTSVGIAGSGERKGVLAGNAYCSTTIENVNVTYGIVTGSANYIAGLVGVVYQSTVSNSSVSNITATGGSYVAGLSGAIYGASSVSNSTVSNITATGCSYVAGMFGVIYGASTVSNSHVEKASVSASASYAGGFIGAEYGKSNISYCSATDVNASVKTSYVGGFAGGVYGCSSISYCCAENVSAYAKCGRSAGGFVGEFYGGANAYRCYAVGDNTATAQFYVGGWAGAISGYTTVEICCAYGSATTTCGYVAGGFAGYSANTTINNAYAQVDVYTATTGGTGGFIGFSALGTKVYNTYAAGTVTNAKGDSSIYNGAYSGYSSLTFCGTNYYDSSINSGLRACGSGGIKCSSLLSYPKGYNTDTMMKQATFVGWDFVDIWRIDENETYPYFWYMGSNKVSEAPIIDSTYEGDKIITGQGVANATVTVTLPDGQEVPAVVDADGIWQIDVPEGVKLIAGEIVSAVQLEINKSESSRVYETVQGGLDPSPYINIYSILNATNPELTYALPGDYVEYNFAVGNNGGTQSVWSDAKVTVNLNGLFTFSTAEIFINGTIVTEGTGEGQYMFDSTTNVLTVYLGDLVYKAEASVTIRIQVDPNATENINDLLLDAKVAI